MGVTPMSEGQKYVAALLELLSTYSNDPKKCEEIQRHDEQSGLGLLYLLASWFAEDNPDKVKTTEKIITADVGDEGADGVVLH